MIAIDTSVFGAVAFEEPDFPRYVEAMRLAQRRMLSAGSYLECAMLTESRLGGRLHLDAWLRDEAVEIVPVDLAMAQLAADGFSRFGKGRHAAGLNYGDCFAYALARSLGVPLLYKGADFAQTDVASALM